LTDRWPAMFVQYINGIEASNGTRCISTGGDFTCTSGDLAVGASVTIRVRYSLMVNTACNTVITNRVSVFSPTDVECRHAEDNTTVINCLNPTQICRTCLEQAIQSGQCRAVYEACQQNPTCNACFQSVVADPRSPNVTCFSHVQSCRMLQCTYNDFCGVGRGGPCDSPFEGPVLCPTGKRSPRTEIEMVAGSTPAPATAPPTPAGRMLAPKMIAVDVKRAEAHSFEIIVTNPLSKDVTVQDLEAQVTHKGGRIELVKLTEAGELVESTTCDVAHVQLGSKWSYTCKVTSAKLLEATSVKVVVRGFSLAAGGYHAVMASKTIA